MNIYRLGNCISIESQHKYITVALSVIARLLGYRLYAKGASVRARHIHTLVLR